MHPYTAPTSAVISFVLIPLALVAALACGVLVAGRRLQIPPTVRLRDLLTTLAGAAAWLCATWLAAGSGVLRAWDRTPPPFAFFVAAIVALACAIAFSPYGRRLAHGVPLWMLVAVQGFRLPLEVAMHRMYEAGVMPVQMSYSGRNFDVVTGATAIVVAGLVAAGRAGPRLVLAWNVLGLALLVNIVTVAILSTPRFAFFGADRLNVWVTFPPFVWLPAVMVLAALAGHLLIFRALWRRA